MLRIDARRIFLFRVSLGILLFFDLQDRFQPLDNFLGMYANFHHEGLWPRSAASSHMQGIFPLWGIGDSTAWYMTLYIINTALIVCLIFGKWSQVVPFLCWLFYATLLTRNSSIVHSGDIVLRQALLCFIFLPQGPCLWDDGEFHCHGILRCLERPAMVSSLACSALHVQLAAIYLFSVFHKSVEDYVVRGEAVYMALQYETLTSFHVIPLFTMSLPVVVLTTLSRMTFFLELVGGIVLMMPFTPATWKRTCHLLMIALQLGFGIHLYLDKFPFVMILLHVVCMPPARRGDDAPRRPAAGHRRRARDAVRETLSLLLIVIIILSNLDSMSNECDKCIFSTSVFANATIPAAARPLHRFFMLEQRWAMFHFRKPYPIHTRYRLIGVLEDGLHVDLLTQREMQVYTTDPYSHVEHARIFQNVARRKYWSWMPRSTEANVIHTLSFSCYKYNVLNYTVVDVESHDGEDGVRLKNVTLYAFPFYLKQKSKSLPQNPNDVNEMAPTTEAPYTIIVMSIHCPLK